MRRASSLLSSIFRILPCALACAQLCASAQSPSNANSANTANNANGNSWHHLRLDDGFLKRAAASKRSAKPVAAASKPAPKAAKDVKDKKENADNKSDVAATPQDPLAQAQDSLKANKIDDAIIVLNNAIKSNPSDYHFLELRAHCYVEIGQNYPALADLTKAISMKPPDTVLHRERANVYFMLHDFQHCLEDLELISKNNAFTASDYFLKGNCYASLGEPKLVVENASAGLKLAPTNADAYFMRAKAYLKLNQRQLGDADFDKAVALEKKR